MVNPISDPDALFARLREDIVGARALIDGPFGPRMITYADYTASGRCLTMLEEYLARTVMVEYSNTHTADSITGARTTDRAREAERLVKQSVGADDGDVAIFVGTGSTGAIKRFQEILGLVVPPGCDVDDCSKRQHNPVVVVGPYEHHSNEITWRETIAEVVECPLDERGLIDLAALDRILADGSFRGRRIIGSFSAASNVTGVRSDVYAIARIMHRHGGIACFDYAALAPYVPIDMHPPGDPKAALDAIFLSPHKMLGGPGTPGVLVFARELYDLEVPTTGGGGTVVYVSPLGHVYADEIERREEAGTPGIIQKIRCGLVFALKDRLGASAIEAREQRWLELALERFERDERLEILGPATHARLPIISFNIRLPDGRYLHHRFVTTLLSDLFGIQSRAGCSCAGPYGHRLLGIGKEESERYRCVILEGFEGLKPGWVRIGLHFVMDETECAFLLDAIALIAELGDRFRPLYDFDVETGGWTHRQRPVATGPLLDLDAVLEGVPLPAWETDPAAAYGRYLTEAREIGAGLPAPDDFTAKPAGLPAGLEDLVFFAW